MRTIRIEHGRRRISSSKKKKLLLNWVIRPSHSALLPSNLLTVHPSDLVWTLAATLDRARFCFPQKQDHLPGRDGRVFAAGRSGRIC